MKNINACLSHNSDNWKTPKMLYNYFINYLGCVDCFPYCSKYDQYEKHYRNELLFINPPYSHLRKEKFINYIQNQIENFNTIFLLIPVRTDTKFFSSIWQFIHHIYFFKGRLHFNDSNSAPFPSMLLVLDIDNNLFEKKVDLVTVSEFIEGGINNG